MPRLQNTRMNFDYCLIYKCIKFCSSDPHLTDYLEGEFLDEQVKSIKEYAENIVNLRRVGAGLGEYIFDKDLKD
ncbi:unnamed protein product [Rotaria magnacalcarata]|uniref:ferroxidase n=1 Tax=Rotaria magnacalcarata TaxID=392030 RepID=A0A820PQ92_9BILA|nr:unnamed protein product [Rotaria magnacalcarata]CAF4407912.1 unnamed protein product [Rotaria magnacalcarata]CAF5223930.1 unnamed protein product [Rotaria magnacalcarata]